MRTFKLHTGKVLFALAVLALLIYTIFPFYIAIATSFGAGSGDGSLYLPETFDFGNYVSVFKEQPFFHNILNSALVSFATVAISLLIAVTASYALARVHFRGRTTLLLTVLGVSMFPQVAVLSGMFELIRMLGLYNNLGSLVLSYTVFSLPFSVWILTTFMRGIPKDLEEAAIVDGATPWQIITRIFMPVLWPAMVTTGLLAFIGAWNEFMFAITFILSNDNRTVPVAISMISGGSQYEMPWGPIMAASVIVTVPLIALVLIFQRKIVEGLTAGAVKG
ncbi:sugar ABC transporter permease [Marinobacterium nitratireducens]|uniref:Sugar ABC transporter permease n=1 Tax=Marinobacterium nitratireducens TaxID=518897 RepID=A0A918DWW8_9GAMM|nr:carbohydrate ABC transporter permease [Marinobacterium nitratireducens]GGO85529.1 sugar ABC transporter permease [Marinobacterium nitratireducens]